MRFFMLLNERNTNMRGEKTWPQPDPLRQKSERSGSFYERFRGISATSRRQNHKFTKTLSRKIDKNQKFLFF
jgi:hypothetical protein